ncbi:MAG: phosphoglycerate kinase [Gemmatimonadota bacterium]|nr:phosphoglycerate kinase [Gemmatimonadota bacterium]
MPVAALNDIDVRGKRVLMRVDYNVPTDADGHIADDTRIRASLPTIRHVVEHGGRAILMSHLGRPKGVTETLRLKPVARRLSELLGQEVQAAVDCVGDEVARQVADMRDGDCLMLENVRFYGEETANDEIFARALAASGDIYVNDAFGSAHRAHASTEGVTQFIDVCVAGFLMQKELEFLYTAMAQPRRPFVVILGGAKVSDKIAVTRRFLEKADSVIIGGGMAYTFLKSSGVETGASLLDTDQLDFAAEVLESADAGYTQLLLPTDHIVAEQLEADASTETVGEIPPGWIGLDIGPETRMRFAVTIAAAGTILWNGPMGVFELPAFAEGTAQVAHAVADATDTGAMSILGGGDTVAAVNKFGLKDRISHVSTGGGASLELLEDKTLPGVAALDK